MERRRRGLGGLTAEKKALLKKIIMEKVREEMRKEALEKKEQKEKLIAEKVQELPSLIDITTENLEKMCNGLQKKLVQAEEEKYDLEQKLCQQEADIKELQMKIQLKGKFVKPILRKVNRSDTSKTRAIRGSKPAHIEEFAKALTKHVEAPVEV
ncbi:troponin I-like [Watersipora subatra]|uniref:troponin I-like n=1 Tax=Watersipora subatra TaxID=2589382 RepID=UPI00355B6CD6